VSGKVLIILSCNLEVEDPSFLRQGYWYCRRYNSSVSRESQSRSEGQAVQSVQRVKSVQRVRSLPLLFVDTLDQSADRRVVKFQMTCDFHLTVPVLVDRLRNQSIPFRLSFPSLIKELL
jgi:hypothetical protein